MKKLFRRALFFLRAFIFISLILISDNLFSQEKYQETAKNVITPALMKGYIDFLASDALFGRATPSPGQDTAAEYIVRNFKAMGISAPNGCYFQELDYAYVELGKDNILKIDDKEFVLKDDFIPFEFTADRKVEGELVFAGYGIESSEYGYNDYQNIDVKGKIVVILRYEPGQVNPDSTKFDGEQISKYSSLRSKVRTAISKGAAGMIVLPGPLNSTSLKPKGYTWPSLSKVLPKDVLPLIIREDDKKKIPVAGGGEEIIKYLFGSSDSLKRIQEKIEKTYIPSSFELKRKTVFGTSVILKPLGGKNVVGYLEGSDPVRKNEILVIGAHYDHVGYRKGKPEDKDSIFNGADDNASGTAGVMAIAKAFTASGKRPPRSVLFILFSGEEKGLLGSDTYVRNPLFPLDSTVAMINLDMISRNAKDSVTLEGENENPDIAAIVKQENKFTGLKLKAGDTDLFGRSDHFNFYKNNIPVIFFFTGLHKDYHKVTDNPDLTDAEKASKVAQLAFLTAWHIANDNKTYSLKKIHLN